jgi:hypothetical protein
MPPKLSATSGQDPEAITRVDITTQMIKEMTDPELEDLLRKMRGNREVSQQKAATRAARTSSPKAPKMDDNEDFI